MWDFNLKCMFNFFYREKTQLLEHLPRVVVQSPPLEVLKMQLVRLLDNLT